ncbi:hypothetical protein MMC30_000871 [Trapelia coarctata]|nr:hypothetical protein [Trapelia coarctata]
MSPPEATRVQKRNKRGPGDAVTKIHGLQSSSVTLNLQLLVNQLTHDSGRSNAVSSEFLGPTSYSTVFRESQANLGEDLLKTSQEDNLSLGSSGDQEEWRTAERSSLSTEVLKHFPDQQRSLDYPTIQCDVDLHIPTLRYCLESILSNYGELLAEPRSPENLASMAQVLLRNGQEAAPFVGPLPNGSNLSLDDDCDGRY